VSQYPGEVALVAACDRAPERANWFCEQYGFARAYTDIEEMLHREVLDGIVSVLPVDSIAEVGSLLLRTGIPCLLEKPLGSSLDEVLHLSELAHATGAQPMVSLNRRFNPFLNLAIDWAKQSGPLTYVRGQMYRHARREGEFVWGTGIHVIDAMRYIGGNVAAMEVQPVSASLSSTPFYLLSLQYTSSALGQIEILPCAGMVEERFEWFGEGFRVSVTTTGGDGESVRCWRDGRLEIERTAAPETPLFLRDGSYEETSAFIRCLREGNPFYPQMEHVLPSLLLCHEAHSTS
jgi:predicted dehydrogenase